jgi:thiamine-phosphate pyrophosphorylase
MNDSLQHKLRQSLKIYFIMGSNNCRKDPVQVLEEAIVGGITLFQYREKGTRSLIGPERHELARKLCRLCKENGIPFIVNDDVELALAVDADGVHVGQEDETAAEVRKKIGTRILGVSAHDEAEAKRAIRDGADYIGVGPLLATLTKEDAKPASGVSVLKRLREAGVGLLIVGIGGITAENAGQVIREGADGVAVITAISENDFPMQAALELKRAVNNAAQSVK